MISDHHQTSYLDNLHMEPAQTQKNILDFPNNWRVSYFGKFFIFFSNKGRQRA